MPDWLLVPQAIWLMLPAYVSNMSPVVVGGGRPIDGGRLWKDGRPILGPGKTWRGLLGGSLAGGLTGLVLHATAHSGPLSPLLLSSFGSAPHAFGLGLALGAGALVGDSVKSFFKRRKGLERGAKWPIADQLDFVAGAWVFAVVADYGWFVSEFTWPMLVFVALFTPAAHLAVNVVGYWLGLKKVPW
ncbi:MAG: CDP-2,3-bis-(O-geranylgeranyl)-sn-glycerol synthase [Methanobacteriota archaeon]